jgi:hypothetical protein
MATSRATKVLHKQARPAALEESPVECGLGPLDTVFARAVGLSALALAALQKGGCTGKQQDLGGKVAPDLARPNQARIRSSVVMNKEEEENDRQCLE